MSPLMDDTELGGKVAAILGVPAAAELLEVLNRSEEDPVHLIGRLLARDDTVTLGEALLEVESGPDDITGFRLIDALERVLG